MRVILLILVMYLVVGCSTIGEKIPTYKREEGMPCHSIDEINTELEMREIETYVNTKRAEIIFKSREVN